jgi:hypothetical protein
MFKVLQLIMAGLMAVTLSASPLVNGAEPVGAAVHSDDLSLEVQFDGAEYTTDDLIGSTVTITNNTDKTMVFVKGSGANTVPDALKFDLGGFVPMYKPEMMTMDFRMDDLGPGETVTYQCDFAPYIPKDGYPGAGAGRDIDYFKSGDFTPAAPGTVTGSLSFTYFLQDSGADPLALYDTSGLEEKTVSTPELSVVIK